MSVDGIVSVLWRHRMARPTGDGEAITWCVCLGWSVDRGSLHEDERAWNAHQAEAVLAHLRAVTMDEGVRERVAAELQAANGPRPRQRCEVGALWRGHASVVMGAFLDALAVDADSEPLTAPRSDGRALPGVVGPDDEGESL